MPAFSASAPGKVILFGEHAVVYGQPAIAIPVHQVQAHTVIMATPGAPTGQVWITAHDVGIDGPLESLPEENPFRVLFENFIETTGIDHIPSCNIKITSTIPIAAGMGSGAAVSVALIRALAASLGLDLPNSQVSMIAYQVEKRHHGNPSGIDNTVITYRQPVFFVRGRPFEILPVENPFSIIIADTGQQSPTAQTVSEVKKKWQQAPDVYEALFNAIGEISRKACQLFRHGPIQQLGILMNQNHEYLQRIGVSCDALDRLVEAARAAGAVGAKLSGGGGGGNMIAQVTPETAATVETALYHAGAIRTILTHVTHKVEPTC